MKGLLLALAISATSALAFGGGNPANAMTAGAVTGISDIAKQDTLTQKVGYYGRYYGYYYPGYYYRPYYYYPRPYYYPRYYYYPWWGHHRRHHYYHHYRHW
jgi:hypothetical protein